MPRRIISDTLRGGEAYVFIARGRRARDQAIESEGEDFAVTEGDAFVAEGDCRSVDDGDAGGAWGDCCCDGGS